MSESKVDSKVIYAAIDFIRVMTAQYGSEDGMKIWEKVCEAIPDPNVKGQTWLHLMGQGTSTTIKVTGTNPSYTDLITQIKVLRTFTLMSLKEAKEIVKDKLGYPVEIKTYTPEKCEQVRKELQAVGFYVE